jgi:prefoldin subunit 5
MTSWVRRAAAPRRVALSICALFGLLSLMTGCGVLSSVANPKVAWALNDPATMNVVVRRADAAESTAKQVDRILTSTPASPDSDWLKNVAPKPDDAAGELKALKDEPMYKTTHARVVTAEVWNRTLPDVQSTDGSSPNVLAMISGDLGDAYAAISAKETDIADLRAQIDAEKEARGAKDVSADDKKEHDKNIDELKKKLAKLEDDVGPLRKKFLDAAKEAAKSAPAAARDAVGPALVSLRQAVDDANIANGAAALRYPLALKSLPDSAKEMVPIIVADIIEEQTGHRPILSGFHPDVKLDGTDIKVTINGLEPGDLGKLSLGDLTTQTLDRSKKWVVHVVTLLGTVSSTRETLSFEQDALDALLDGFAAGGWKRTDLAKLPAWDDPKVASAQARVHTRGGAGVAEAQAKGAKVGKSTKTAGATTPTADPKPGVKTDKPGSKKPGSKATGNAPSPATGSNSKPTKGGKPTATIPTTGGPDKAPVRDFTP